MNSTITAAISAAIICSGAAGAQDASWRDRADPERYEAGEMHLGLFYDGEREGSMRYGWRVEGDTLHIYDRTMWGSREIYESFEAEMAADDLDPQSLSIRFYQESAILYIDAGFAPGRVEGERRIQQPLQDIQAAPFETELPEGALIRGAAFMLAGAVPLAVGDQVEFPWYAPLSGQTATVTLTAVETVQIETPAGAFDTIRIELRGGSPDNDIYVDQASGRVVRIDVLGQPMQFLALPEAG